MHPPGPPVLARHPLISSALAVTAHGAHPLLTVPRGALPPGCVNLEATTCHCVQLHTTPCSQTAGARAVWASSLLPALTRAHAELPAEGTGPCPGMSLPLALGGQGWPRPACQAGPAGGLILPEEGSVPREMSQARWVPRGHPEALWRSGDLSSFGVSA